MNLEFSRKLLNAPPYLFVEIEKKLEQAVKKGEDIIDLAVGDPDTPTPSFVVEKFSEIIWRPEFHRYPHYDGSDEFRQTVSAFMKNKYDIDVSYEHEIVALLGAKEGVAHIFLAFINEGDFALVPDPAYPVYKTATLFAGGVPYPMPLLPENGYLPDLSKIPEEVAQRAKIMFINYPNNPTGAVADRHFYKRAVEYCIENNIVLCNDNAYCDFIYGKDKMVSVFNIEGAKECAIEFYTCSKSYNMTGWRIGFAIGNDKVINGLKAVKHNLDSGQFTALQYACMEALKRGHDFTIHMKNIYKERISLALEKLGRAGLNVKAPEGTFYIWTPVPQGFDSMSFSNFLLEKAKVMVAPGVGFGRHGEGFFRISLTAAQKRLNEALERICKAL